MVDRKNLLRIWKCQEPGCQWQFKRKDHLEQHEATHTGEKPFACSKCTKTFLLKQTRDRHETTHTKEQPYQCQQCPRAFNNRPNLTRHIECIHKQQRFYECPGCAKLFNQSGDRNRHVKALHPELWRRVDPKLQRALQEIRLHEVLHARESDRGKVRRLPPQIEILAAHLLHTPSPTSIIDILRLIYNSQHFKIGLARQPLPLLRQMLRVYLPKSNQSGFQSEPSVLHAFRRMMRTVYD